MQNGCCRVGTSASCKRDTATSEGWKMNGHLHTGAAGSGPRSCAKPSPIILDRIKVESDRIVFDVSIDDPRYRRTTEIFAAAALAERPNLGEHACMNSLGPTFSAVIDDTPIPHFLEHAVIDMLVEQSSSKEDAHVGTSAWTNPRAGRARIQISMKDDLVVLASFNRALEWTNQLLEQIMGK